ncbi:MAG: HAD family hydrolase [Pseudomonadota bacterium]
MTLPTIAFDGDDTLWHNETLFAGTQQHLRDILAAHVPAETIDRTLLARERANLALFGYGVKGFTLSMIETAIEVSDATVTAAEIQRLIELGKAMLSSPVNPIDGVDAVVESLKRRGHRLMVITKGDLFDQESKVARSGLADLFDAVEIVSEKDEATYRAILDRHEIAPADFVMVGNSIRSDILPVLALGGHAIHVPYAITWAIEHADHTADLPPILKAGSIAEVPEMIAGL